MLTILVFSDDRFSPLSDRKASIFGFISFSLNKFYPFMLLIVSAILFINIFYLKNNNIPIYIFLYKKIKKSIKGLG